MTQNQPHTADWRTQATISVERAGKVLGIARASAYTAARAGELPTVRIGRRLLVPVTALRRMLGELQDDHDPGSSRAAGKVDDGTVQTPVY